MSEMEWYLKKNMKKNPNPSQVSSQNNQKNVCAHSKNHRQTCERKKETNKRKKKLCWLELHKFGSVSTINHIHFMAFAVRHFIVNVNSIKIETVSTLYCILNRLRFRVQCTRIFFSKNHFFNCKLCANHDLSIEFHFESKMKKKKIPSAKIVLNRLFGEFLLRDYVIVLVYIDWYESGPL